MRKNFNSSVYNLFRDRRKGPSVWISFIKLFAVLNWIIITAIIILIGASAPKQVTFFDRIFNISRADIWQFNNIELITSLFVFMFFGSGISLIANTRYLKRKDDRISLSNLTAFLFSWIIIIIYFTIFK